jgi:SIR2-like domain
MTDNVIILGAGASVDAGIPLLSNFVDKMWELAMRGTHDGEPLSDDDKKIFSEAMKVRNELDSYHGRASFNDRNIEDILSILTFSTIGGKRSDREKLNWIVKAIARTIELTCTVKHSGDLETLETGLLERDIYWNFWENLFKRFNLALNSFPSIINFNYDLVLERSLFKTLISERIRQAYNEPEEPARFPFDGIIMEYYYKPINYLAYKIKEARKWGKGSFTPHPAEEIIETRLEQCNTNALTRPLKIEILKLHGSLNFPTHINQTQKEYTPTNLTENPYIVPPTINKWVSKNDQAMWGAGLRMLREVKNIIFIGYSLPQTDIYVQYFIKAGIGPNTNLNKIYVFNPVLYQSGKEQMKERFGNCFSPQLRDRIVFYPSGIGTFRDFVNLIANDLTLFFT